MPEAITSDYLTLVGKGDQTAGKCADVIKSKYKISADRFVYMLANRSPISTLAHLEKTTAQYELAEMAGDQTLARKMAEELDRYFMPELKAEELDGVKDDSHDSSNEGGEGPGPNELTVTEVEVPKAVNRALEQDGWVVLV